MHHIHLFIFFRFEKRWPVWAAVFVNSQCFCLLSDANPLFTTINNYADEHCAPPFLSCLCFSPFFISICFFFRSLVRPLESVCYWAQSVKVSSCKVCEVCSVCMYVYCVFVSVSIYVYLCLCLYVYLCLFMSMYVNIRVLQVFNVWRPSVVKRSSAQPGPLYARHCSAPVPSSASQK